MYIERALQLKEVLKHKSCFLLGPRQTGKSSLIRELFSEHKTYNLLDAQTFRKLSHSPNRLREECSATDKIIVIDEIQKLPSLLDEIHLLIEEKGMRFLLTGSSARKLRRGGVNLLGGRAWTRHLHPLTSNELGAQFDIVKAVNVGLLPYVYLSAFSEDELAAYAGTYLKEEIAAEGLTRNIPAFSRFLQVAALCNGQLLNYTKIANDAQIPRTTVREYFQILKDTLLAYELTTYKSTSKRKNPSTSKFYFFDCGVVRHLQGRTKIIPETTEFGELFETLIFHELRSYVDYTNQLPIHLWRSRSGNEVDFVLGESTAIECKATKNVSNNDLKGLHLLHKETKMKHRIVVCLDDQERTVNGVDILPANIFLQRLWSGQIT